MIYLRTCRSQAMTTNKPRVVAYHHINKENPEHRGVSLHLDASCTSTLISTEPLVRLSDYEALQAEFEEFKNKAHEWVRSGLELVDNAPRRFDFYCQKIEALRSDRDQQYDMKVKARAQRDEAARMLKAKEAENFALAATACHGGYGDDFGHFRCNYQDEIRKLQAECDQLRKDAEIGKIVWKFIDRMNDVCPQFDPADRIISEFIDKVNPIIDEAMQESKPCSLSS